MRAIGAKAAKRARSDEQRRRRMRELDAASPIRPRPADLITGQAAQAELARIKARRS